MAPRELLIEILAGARILNAYVCDRTGCQRCYSESVGYFDFVDGRLLLDKRPILCARDGHARFLQVVGVSGNKVWQCPACGEVVKI